MEFHSTRSFNRMSGSSSHDGKVLAVGCGGVALFPDYAEVKRMYVHHTARGQGVADAILDRIEQEVRGAGLSVLRLETGVARSQRCGSMCERGFGNVRRSAPMAEAAGSHRGERVLREADVAWMGQGVALRSPLPFRRRFQARHQLWQDQYITEVRPLRVGNAHFGTSEAVPARCGLAEHPAHHPADHAAGPTTTATASVTIAATSATAAPATVAVARTGLIAIDIHSRRGRHDFGQQGLVLQLVQIAGFGIAAGGLPPDKHGTGGLSNLPFTFVSKPSPFRRRCTSRRCPLSSPI